MQSTLKQSKSSAFVKLPKESKNDPKQITNEIDIYAKQRLILIEAIDQYINWRKNMDVSDGRGYQLGKFTKLRHFFSFGRDHANKLKENLRANQLTPIDILQSHFKEKFDLHNHSLDTYMLEGILQNSKIFLITQKFENVRTKKGREQFREIILSHKIGKFGDYAFSIAQEESKSKDGLELALNYYAIAIEKNHTKAFYEVKKIAENGHAEAQYMIGYLHYHRNNDIVTAIHWCSLAAEQNHDQAIAYLFNTQFSSEQYLILARKYEEGQGVKQNMKNALVFYEKAFALGNKFAALRLGKYYENDKLKSFDYYYIAAQQVDMDALNKIEAIAEYLDNNKLKSRVAQVYLNHHKDPQAAFKRLKKLADKKDEEAFEEINKYAKANGHYAYIIGQLCEEDKSENNLVAACYYYILADQNSNVLAKQRLNAIFVSNKLSTKDMVQIGKQYCNHLNGIKLDYNEARRWFEKASDCESGAAQYELAIMYQEGLGITKDNVKAARFFQMACSNGFSPAKTKLDTLLNSNKISTLELSAIANMYLNEGEGVSSNAFKFLKKAAERGDPSSNLHLAQFYQVDHEDHPKNPKLAYQYYLQAAKQGQSEALAPLERLAEETSAENQIALSQIYAAFFRNAEKAEYWRVKANEINQFEFKT